MKVIFLLDSTDEKGQIVEKNVRALEIDPAQTLQLRQTAPNQTWLCAPHPDGNKDHVVNILAFPIGLKKDPEPEAVPVPEVPKAKKAKKARRGK